MSFQFLNPGRLVDRELELVAPEPRWVDDMLAAAVHPLSRLEGQFSSLTREKLMDFLRAAPGGRQSGEGARRVPAYHFWMHLCESATEPLPTWGAGPPPVRLAGGIGLRIGNSRDLEMYYGHIGYNVFPAVRGNHYAERACRLLLPLARAHGMTTMWITCNPENVASRRTCEHLGCELVDTVELPLDHPLFLRGERQKCRYRLDL